MANPLACPLLFPTGNAGWHKNYTSTTGVRMTRLQYIRGQIFLNDRILYGGKLFQQWLLTEIIAHRNEVAAYHRDKQLAAMSAEAPVRVAPRDAAEAARQAGDPSKAGKPVRLYLPEGIWGSEAQYRKRYLDAMAFAARHGYDLFITVTMNPRTEAFTANLHGLGATDRFDISERVFAAITKRVMDALRSGKLVGKVAGLLLAFEWQARGLRHFHLLVKLEDLQRDMGLLGTLVRCDIPTGKTEADKALRDAVLSKMVHEPCQLASGKWDPA